MWKNILKKLDDYINPIVVKELRQTVNSKIVPVAMVALLTMQLGAMVIFITEANVSSAGYGSKFFGWIMGILAVICLFGICATSAQRFAKERKRDGLDIIHSTIMSPYQIAQGKLFSSIVMAMFLFSLCLPFLGVSYFMRGIDIPSIVWGIAIAFVALIPLFQFAILVGSLTNERFASGIVAFSMIVGIPMLIGTLANSSHIMLGFAMTWLVFLWCSYVALLLTGFGFFATIAIIMTRTANRALPLRLYLIGVWLILAITSLALYGYFKDVGIFSLWYVASIIIFSITAIASISERDQQSRRVLKQTPKHRLLRPLFFLISSGRSNGLLFSALFLLMTIGGGFMLKSTITYDNFIPDETFMFFNTIAAFTMLYSLLSHFFGLIVKRFVPTLSAFVGLLFFIIIFNLGPVLINILIHFKLPSTRGDNMLFFIFSPIIFDSRQYRSLGLTVNAICAGALLLWLLYSVINNKKTALVEIDN